MSTFESLVLFPPELKGKFQYPAQELVDQLEPERRERLEALAAAAADLETAEAEHADAVEHIRDLAQMIIERKSALPKPPTFLELWRQSLNR